MPVGPFSLPVPGLAMVVDPQTAPAARRLCCRLLVVDDDTLVRQLATTILLRAGHDARPAGDIEEGLAVLQAIPIDIALVDHELPGVSGLSGLGALLEAGARTAVLMSGHGAERVMGTHTASVPFLQKPFDAATLLATVERIALSLPT